MPENLGPPGRERPGPTPETGPIQKSADNTTTTDEPIICHGGVAEWRRRRRASERLMPLCRCGPDPWLCRCRPTDPPLSDHQVDGWRSAAIDIIEDGHMPIVPAEVVRRLWKRGDRALAQRLWELAR
jgi:hypothetical protein